MTTYAKEKQFAIAAVRRACRLTSGLFNNLMETEKFDKNDRTPVTVGDFAAQAVINTMLGEAFPQDQIVAEENAAELRQESGVLLRDRVVQLANETLTANPEFDDDVAWGIGPGQVRTADALLDAIDKGCHPGGQTGRIWTLDPIDGTKWFMQGGPYAVSLALVVNGHVQLGVMGCPNFPVDPANINGGRGCIFVAVKGQGAEQLTMFGEHPVRLVIPPFTRHTLNLIESAKPSEALRSLNNRVAAMLGITRAHVVMDSMSTYSSVARGDGAAYIRFTTRVDYEEKIWDHASGVILVEEAGGKVTDMRGLPFDFGIGRSLGKNFEIVAAGKEAHTMILEAVQKARDVEIEGDAHGESD